MKYICTHLMRTLEQTKRMKPNLEKKTHTQYFKAEKIERVKEREREM